MPTFPFNCRLSIQLGKKSIKTEDISYDGKSQNNQYSAELPCFALRAANVALFFLGFLYRSYRAEDEILHTHPKSVFIF